MNKFLSLTPGATLQHIATGATFADGPLYIPDDNTVRFSDVSGQRILSLSLDTGETTVWQNQVPHPGARAFHPDLGIVQCSTGRRAIEKAPLVPFMDAEVLIDFYEGGQLNGPHDLVVHPIDATVWFTDPMIGLTEPGRGPGGESGYGRAYVFTLDHHGDLTPVITELTSPTGIALSPDARHVYVSNAADRDSTGGMPRGPSAERAFSSGHSITDADGRHHVWVFDLNAESQVVRGSGRVLAAATAGVPGGLAVDREHRVWIACGDGILVVTSEGETVGHIPSPEPVTNVTFGGKEGGDLFATSLTGLYRISTTTGASA